MRDMVTPHVIITRALRAWLGMPREPVVVPGTRCVICYTVRGDRLDVVAVFHGRQQWPRRL